MPKELSPEDRYHFDEFLEDMELNAAELISEALCVPTEKLGLGKDIVSELFITDEFLACNEEEICDLVSVGKFEAVPLNKVHAVGGYVFYDSTDPYIFELCAIAMRND